MYTLIIVDYNSLENTLKYIDLCKENLGKTGAGHVMIVENGDQENAPELLRQYYGEETAQTVKDKTVRLYEKDWQTICFCSSGGNIGYARGNNLGAEIARELWNDPYYIISNNDLIFPTPVDLRLTTALFTENPQIGVIGPAVTSPDTTPQSPRVWKSAFHRLIVCTWVSSFGAFLPEKTYNRLSDKVCDDTDHNAVTGKCAWVSGCFMLVKADAFWQAGAFDPHTFLYAEEPILSCRMERAGFEVWFCRELSIIHNHAQTTKKALSVLRMRQLDYEANRYYFKEYRKTNPILLTLADWNFAVYKGIFKLWQKVKSKRN